MQRDGIMYEVSVMWEFLNEVSVMRECAHVCARVCEREIKVSTACMRASWNHIGE